MMVETILESSQDFGMSNGALPQWKRELLQRRAARSRPAATPPAQPPPPPPSLEEEELRYGPGIVKRLKSRYLSLALRDAPRRRPSVLRRAASLEHLLDERPPPSPAPRHHAHARPPRPASLLAPAAALALPPAHRRESVKRARSVDALSRLDSRDDPPPLLSPPPPPPPPLAPRPPPQPRAARPPRRPTPLLRDTERPPPDVVRSTLRKFESAPTRRAAPAARVSAVLRGLEGPLRTSTPEPRDGTEIPPSPSPRTPSPNPPPTAVTAPPNPIDPPSVDEPEGAGPRPVSRAALEGIARAGSTVRYAFETPLAGSHLPPLAAANPVLLSRSRQIGIIRPMPARIVDDAVAPVIDDVAGKSPEPTPAPRFASPPPIDVEPATPGRIERKDPPPAAVVEPIPRTPPEPTPRTPPEPAVRPISPTPPDRDSSPEPKSKLVRKTEEIAVPLVNGHAAPERPAPEVRTLISKIGAAGIERAWSGSGERKPAEPAQEKASPVAPWARGGGGGGDSPAPARRPRVPAPAPASTSVVFNFSNRKEVPDYIENDGIILRANRRDRIKAGEAGVVVLRPEALARCDSDSETEVDCGPPSPCNVRFVNDNVLINGRSSMPDRPNRDRIAKLKLQFDDSLTRTFEYPSETSLSEQTAPPGTPPPAAAPAPAPAPAPQLAESPLHATLAANTHIASAALSNYTPSKTLSDAFQLGVTRHHALADTDDTDTMSDSLPESDPGADAGAGAGAGAGCAAGAARSWSEARTHATDLLF